MSDKTSQQPPLPDRDSMDYDVVIVGAGPSGLAAAIRLKQLAAEQGREISVCVLEKAAAVGGHILSGAVIDTSALDELLPNWRNSSLPTFGEVTSEDFLLLSASQAHAIPHGLLPPVLRNDGCHIVSLGLVCQWLGEQAEALGVEIYPGFAASEVLYGAQGEVVGVATGDMGLDKHGQQKPGYARGMALLAKYTLFAEGSRGSLTRQLEAKFDLRKAADPQHYGLGIKEIWRIKPEAYQAGRAFHTLGWPLNNDTGGGGFLYHQAENQVAVGFVVHLNYPNPWTSPFQEFQKFKTHPAIRAILEGGERIAYGARTIVEGGVQSLPELVFPGGALIGCGAGLLNVPRIKGTHNAMKSGMLAAESVAAALASQRKHDTLDSYTSAVRNSAIWRDLQPVRNIKPALSKFGTWGGMLYAGLELWLHHVGIQLPWTLRHPTPDNQSLRRAADMPKPDYPAPDGKLTFDRNTSLALANIQHDDDQPVHLTLQEPAREIAANLSDYACPEQRYCPAGVYEIVEQDHAPKLQINAQNCVHCKACDIKNLSQNIVWIPPEGGSGPCYTGM